MSVLIKGMEMPTNCQHCPCVDDDSRYCKAANEYIPMLGKPKFCPLIEVPTPHGRLIDANELYEKTAEWEAQALHMVEETMNDEDKTEWQRWSEVLTERSAFKYDVADAPTIIEAGKGEGDEHTD